MEQRRVAVKVSLGIAGKPVKIAQYVTKKFVADVAISFRNASHELF